jgi:hypothetical protein
MKTPNLVAHATAGHDVWWLNTDIVNRNETVHVRFDISMATVMTPHILAGTNVSRNMVCPFLPWKQSHNQDADNTKTFLVIIVNILLKVALSATVEMRE